MKKMLTIVEVKKWVHGEVHYTIRTTFICVSKFPKYKKKSEKESPLDPAPWQPGEVPHPLKTWPWFYGGSNGKLVVGTPWEDSPAQWAHLAPPIWKQLQQLKRRGDQP